MSEVSIRPKGNPNYQQAKPALKVKKVGVEIFLIQRDDNNGDKARYEDFMLSLYPYTPDSPRELNVSTGGDPRKFSWTKEGDLLVQVEYIEWEQEVSNAADNKKY